jgi:ABC-type multidrug transport system permease subunit
LVKKLAYQALGSIFIDSSDTREFLFNMDNFNRGTGIILLPIVALIAYFPYENPVIAVFSGVFTTLVFYIMLLKRGVSILLKKQFPIFYLFLYLCTLEFLPLLLIYKIVVN